MARWSLLSAMPIYVPRVSDGAAELFVSRLRLVQTPWFGVYVHVIHRPDVDPDPHDHPWPFVSVVLSGWYLEELSDTPAWYDGSLLASPRGWRVHKPLRPRIMRRRRAHRIIDTHGGPVWTLCVIGRDRGDWSFWTPEGRVPWREYREAIRGAAAGRPGE